MSESAPNAIPLIDYLDQLENELQIGIPKVLAGDDPGAVHKTRVATRRMTVASDVLRPVTTKKTRRPVEKTWKQVRKNLGAIRDLDVMLGHLDEFENATDANAIKLLKDYLANRRQRALTRAGKALSPRRIQDRLEKWANLREQIFQAGLSINTLISESIHLRLDAFAELADKGEHPDPHQLRIAGKILRYTLELAEPQGLQLPHGVLSHFKSMQDALGMWHDMVVLTQHTLKEFLDGELALHGRDTAGQMISLAGKMYLQSQSELEKFWVLWKSNGNEICQKIREAFPLTVPNEPENIGDMEVIAN
jgi:CHAD domain-containing protein